MVNNRMILLQVFKLESPVWLKYLQLRMLSHHGTEAVCALNDLCVYGKSAAEDLEDRLSSDQELEEESKPVPILPIPAVPASLQEPFLDNGSQAEDQLSKTENQTTEPTKTETTQNEKVEKTSQGEEKSGKKSLENLDDGKSLKDLLEKKQDIKVSTHTLLPDPSTLTKHNGLLRLSSTFSLQSSVTALAFLTGKFVQKSSYLLQDMLNFIKQKMLLGSM